MGTINYEDHRRRLREEDERRRRAEEDRRRRQREEDSRRASQAALNTTLGIALGVALFS